MKLPLELKGRGGRLLIRAAMLFVLAAGGLEVRHYVRFHDFAGYGWHVDVVARDADIGVPGVNKMYGLWLTNSTVRPRVFQGVLLPGGYIGSGVLYRDEIQKWDVNTRSWVTMTSTTKNDWVAYEQVTTKIWPTQSVGVSGWDAIGGREGPHGDRACKGDRVRWAVYSSFTELDATVLYSPVFTISDGC